MQNLGKQIIKLTGSDFTYPVQIDYANASTETTIKLESAGKIQAYAINPQTGAIRLIQTKTPYQYDPDEIVFIWHKRQGLTASIAIGPK